MAFDQNGPETQLGFEALLAEAETENRNRIFERETAHLPGDLEEGLAFYRTLLALHHEAMMLADEDEVMRLRREAHSLAVKLNGGDAGILAHDDSPGNLLARATAANAGAEPLWGQQGDFVVRIGALKARIELDGIFGIGGSHCYWMGFSAHALEHDKSFLSATGYRSFLGIYAEPRAGLLPSAFVETVISRYVETDLKGTLVSIEPRYCSIPD